jgi:uncharacterized cupredoxin-like copper-binding protein
MKTDRLNPRAASRVSMAAVALVAAACASTGSAGWTYAPLGPTATPAASGSASPGASGSAVPGTPAASGSPGASASPTASGSPAASGSPGSSAGGNVIDLEETNTLQILQAGQPVTELHFTVGQSYTFHINNIAGFDHDFYLGPPDRLQSGDVTDLPGVPVNQQGVQDFTWTATADAATWQFSCTVLGHYATMHGAVVLNGQ